MYTLPTKSGKILSLCIRIALYNHIKHFCLMVLYLPPADIPYSVSEMKMTLAQKVG